MPDHQKHVEQHRKRIEKALHRLLGRSEPNSVYEPITYVLSPGGKRLRAVLATLACEAVGGAPSGALNAAVAVEVLHNFTLVHDDVMDRAALRRGKQTVHERWDANTAILAGDAMIALAYRSLLRTDAAVLRSVIRVFTAAFAEVCEGQGMDKEFEGRDDVTVEQYVQMIRSKTARVISAAPEIGALIGQGSDSQVKALRRFGENLGIAFQLNDDVLDIVGTEEQFGKTIGGDVKERKRTFLLLTALGRATDKDRKFLNELKKAGPVTPSIVARVRSIYESTCALTEARKEVARRTLAAQRSLSFLPASEARDALHWLADKLVARTS